MATSEHNSQSMSEGDSYLGQLVSAAMNGPEVGFNGDLRHLGRLRLLLRPRVAPAGTGHPASDDHREPVRRRRSTDSNIATFASLIAFTEHTFGLQPRLSSVDGSAYDYGSSFNFSQAPLSPIHMVALKPISRAEQQQIADAPTESDDGPT